MNWVVGGFIGVGIRFLKFLFLYGYLDCIVVIKIGSVVFVRIGLNVYC